ncbi:MAG: hypothetical protein ACOC2U_02225 [bacterium]
MNYEDLFIEFMEMDDIVYENDYMKVVKIIKEIPTGSSKYVKRVQLVKWKNKKTDVPDLDIRTFSLKDNKYKKGITLNRIEAKALHQALNDFYAKRDL